MNNSSMVNNASFSIEELIHHLDYFHLILLAIAVFFAALHAIHNVKKYLRLWRTRYIRKVWGIKNGDRVTVICSELDKPEKKQNPQPREFIYNLKFGDVDAYFEVIVTLLRLYPDIKLRVISAGEAEKSRIDLKQHLILIGGPDYNSFTDRILDKNITQYRYLGPDLDKHSANQPEEVVLYDSLNNKEFFENTEMKDYGYLERISNPDDPKKNIILIGGCHTIGVAGAAKTFSMAESEHGEIPSIVLENAKKAAKKISKKSEFSVRVNVERVGQTINVPIVREDNVTVKGNN